MNSEIQLVSARGTASAVSQVLVAAFDNPWYISKSEDYNHGEFSYSRKIINRSQEKLEKPTCPYLSHHSSSLNTVAYNCNFASLQIAVDSCAVNCNDFDSDFVFNFLSHLCLDELNTIMTQVPMPSPPKTVDPQYHKWSLTICDGCFDTLKSSKM